MNVAEFLVPALAPWVCLRRFGPVADTRLARVIRRSGFVAIYGLMAIVVGVSQVIGTDQDHADHAG